ncbi:MAG: GspH/FimT family pseudopilin, partial [Proteobacteria bacterium]|nr:GspH/FimT family pseudopilin [Pseudomonadota bacterium]
MKVRGFTLIELIITLLIGSLLLAWGVPNYRDFKLRREVVDHTNDFVYSLSLARSEAIRYGTDVRVEPVGGDW